MAEKMDGVSNGNGRSVFCSLDSRMSFLPGEAYVNGGLNSRRQMAPLASIGNVERNGTVVANGGSGTAVTNGGTTVTNGARSQCYRHSMQEKLITDVVHGHMAFSGPCLEVLDTPQMQRLRKLKQLGAVPWVFPCANHSRFEHSLGACYLAGQLGRKIYDRQHEELDMQRQDIEKLEVAGLVHDLGHGPFSHVFDNEVIKQLDPHSDWKHEDMSVAMFSWLVDDNNLDLDGDFIKNVQELVTASLPDSKKSMTTKKFLYDVVANGRTGIDVDKFDYLARDSLLCNVPTGFDHKRIMEKVRVVEDMICFRWSEAEDVYNMFTARGKMHKVVYTHRKVKAVEYMIVDALKEAAPVFNWLEAIRSPQEFYKLNDSVLDRIDYGTDDGLKASKRILDRINRRDLYEYINECAVPAAQIPYYKSKRVEPMDIASYQCDGYKQFRAEDIIVQNLKVDFGFGMQNPMDNVGWYEDTEDGRLRSFHLTKDQISNMLPAGTCDLKIRVYSRINTPEMVKAVGEAFERYQRHVFKGELRQAHSTTPSKRRWPDTPSSPRSPVQRRM